MATINYWFPQFTIYQMDVILGVISLGFAAILLGMKNNLFKLKKNSLRGLYDISLSIGTVLTLLSAFVATSTFGGEYIIKFYGWPLPFAIYRQTLTNTRHRLSLNLYYFLDLYFYGLITYYITILVVAIKNGDKKLFYISLTVLIISFILLILLILKLRL